MYFLPIISLPPRSSSNHALDIIKVCWLLFPHHFPRQHVSKIGTFANSRKIVLFVSGENVGRFSIRCLLLQSRVPHSSVRKTPPPRAPKAHSAFLIPSSAPCPSINMSRRLTCFSACLVSDRHANTCSPSALSSLYPHST